MFALVGAEYVLRWLPKGTHQWRRFVTPDELDDLLSASKLAVTARTGVRVNPLTRVQDQASPDGGSDRLSLP